MIVFENVRKVYEPNVVALDGLSLTVDKGEFVFLVGPSGSGKSTLVRLLIKELEPTDGRIIVGGRELGRLKKSRVPMLRRNIGCVFQDFKLLPNRTAFENIAYALKVRGEPGRTIRAQVPEVLNLVGLSHKASSFPDELSGGEQQRVSIARAFVNHPPLLLCDEPTGNLDPDTSVGIMQLLYRINRAGTTVVMATHDREMVDKMRRRVIALEDGKLMRDERRGGLRIDGGPEGSPTGRLVRARLFVGEALRSITANLSTTVAATMTVLIGMFLLGLFIALGSWVVSWTEHVKKEVLVNVYFELDATEQQIVTTRNRLARMPEVEKVVYVSPDEALALMKKEHPDLFEVPLPTNPLPPALKVTPRDAEQVEVVAQRLEPPPAGVEQVNYGKKQTDRVLKVAGIIELVFLVASADPPRGIDHSHREHDPTFDLLAPSRDRGDEARRCDELVRARALHAGGSDLRPTRGRDRGRAPVPRAGACSSGRLQRHDSGGWLGRQGLGLRSDRRCSRSCRSRPRRPRVGHHTETLPARLIGAVRGLRLGPYTQGPTFRMRRASAIACAALLLTVAAVLDVEGLRGEASVPAPSAPHPFQAVRPPPVIPQVTVEEPPVAPPIRSQSRRRRACLSGASEADRPRASSGPARELVLPRAS